MKTVPLTQGQVAIVDDEDFERISAHKWNAAWNESTKSFYAQSNVAGGLRRQRTIIMHRMIMGASRGQEVDHRNRDTLDNRRRNLRLCTQAQNTLNRGIQRNNTSGFKGVKKHTQCNRWMACVQLNRRRLYLGLFANPKDAAVAYDEAVVRVHGEFAVANSSLGLL